MEGKYLNEKYFDNKKQIENWKNFLKLREKKRENGKKGSIKKMEKYINSLCILE